MQKHIWAKGRPNLEEAMLLARAKLADSGFSIDKKQAVAIALVAILAIAGGLILYKTSQPKPVIINKEQADIESSGSGQTAPRNGMRAKTGAPPLVVHVAGAVANPGVYHLQEDSRVIDAVGAAGGVLDTADENALNLAAKIFDGQKIYVPKKGETISQPQASGTGDTVLGDSVKINLNTATLEQLDSLPGIGPVTAKKIIDYRDRHGPFRQIDELKQIDGMGSKKFDRIKDSLCVD